MKFQGTENYVATEDLMIAVNAALTLQRPLLIKGEIKLFLHRETVWSSIDRLYIGQKHIPLTQTVVYKKPYPETNELTVNFSGDRDAIFVKFSAACEVRLKRTKKQTIPDEYASVFSSPHIKTIPS